MKVATFVLAVLATVLSALSLGWQAAIYVLSGGRVKADLIVGATNRAGTGLISSRAGGRGPGSMREIADQGYDVPIVGVTVRNVGRLAVTIQRWSLRETTTRVEFVPVGEGRGPALPHRLEPGEQATFYTDARTAAGLRAAAQTAATGRVGVGARVSLGNGRTLDTEAAL